MRAFGLFIDVRICKALRLVEDDTAAVRRRGIALAMRLDKGEMQFYGQTVNHIFAIVIGIAALGFLIWLFIPTASHKYGGDGELIDPSDSLQIGMLIGLMGGGIPDASVAQFALKRFEEIHGRKATTKDVGIVVGLMSGEKS